MSEFATVTSGAEIQSTWANAMIDHAFEKPCAFIIRKNGSNYEAVYGQGSNQAGKLLSAATSTSLHTCANETITNGLTSGRTWLERIVFLGNLEIVGKIVQDRFTELDFSQASLKQPDNNNLNDYLIDCSAILDASESRIVCGILDGNQANGNPATKGIFHAGTLTQGLIKNMGSTAVEINAIVRSNVHHVTFDSNLGTSIDCVTNATAWVDVVHNHITNSSKGVEVEGESLVAHNQFNAATTCGIEVNGAYNRIESNDIDACVVGVNLLSGGDKNQVRFNHFETLTSGIVENSGASQNKFFGNYNVSVTTPITFISNLSFAKENQGFNPYGAIANPFKNTATYGVGLLGTAATPTASRTYVIQNVDCIISSTNSGNADNAIQIYDSSGNAINPSTLSTLDCYYLPIGYRINWGAYTGAAPTVVACGV